MFSSKSFAPRTLSGFVRLLFWHSLTFTITTPYVRWLTKRWQYVVSVPLVAGSADAVAEAYPEPKAIDRAWIPHALFGILWLFAGSFQFQNAKLYGERFHKIFGYIAIFCYLGHLSAAGFTLYTDGLKHTFINKVMLSGDLFGSGYYMVQGILDVTTRKDTKGWLQSHKDNMFAGFVTSIEGAGTIRTIAFLHFLLESTGIKRTSLLWKLMGAGIRECQMKHRIVSTHCGWEYSFRMIWIRFLSNCYLTFHSSYTPSFKKKIMPNRWKAWGLTLVFLVLAYDQDIDSTYACYAMLAVQVAIMLGWLSDAEKKPVEVDAKLAYALELRNSATTKLGLSTPRRFDVDVVETVWTSGPLAEADSEVEEQPEFSEESEFEFEDEVPEGEIPPHVLIERETSARQLRSTIDVLNELGHVRPEGSKIDLLKEVGHASTRTLEGTPRDSKTGFNFLDLVEGENSDDERPEGTQSYANLSAFASTTELNLREEGSFKRSHTMMDLLRTRSLRSTGSGFGSLRRLDSYLSTHRASRPNFLDISRKFSAIELQ